MTESSADFLPLWMLIAAGFGFIAGELCGDYRRHRDCLQKANDEFRERLQERLPEIKLPDTEPIQRALKEQRGIINDLHKHLLAVSKCLEKQPK